MTQAPKPRSRRPRSFRPLAPAIPLLLAGVLLVACGGSSSSTATSTASPSSAPTKPAYCSDLANLQGSIKALGQVNLVQGGTEALKKALGQVKTNAQALETSVKGELTSQVTALKDSLTQLSATSKELAAAPSAAAVGQVNSQISAVSTSVKDFAAAAKCG